jgi:aspartyl-tRNA(Asn)/glutamyl-tRNA(Gln) amidotransferase subunit A
LLVRRDFDEAFRVSNPLYTDASHSSNEDGVDVILHPSSILSAPPLLAGTSAASSSIDDYVQDMLTVPASLAGIPALNVPIAGEGEGAWPVGVSVVGQWGSDEFVLEVGNALEDIESSPNS